MKKQGLKDPKLGSTCQPFAFTECRWDARGDQGERAGAGAPPVAALGIIGQVAPRLPIDMDKINSS